MIISTDGACKWGGTPECVSCGVAFIQTVDDNMLFKALVEDASTSQRGELNGLILALEYAVENLDYEDTIIITDSEYLYNSVMKEWCFKWRQNNWQGSTGIVKNVDKWERITELLDKLGPSNVFLQWTKGHLISNLSPSLVKRIMNTDNTGLQLYSNIQSFANRPSDKQRIADELNKHRVEHGLHKLPDDTAIEWVSMNVMADLLAGYIKDTAIEAGKV